MDVTDLTAELDAALRSQGTATRAAKERAYLKSTLEHYGVTVPAIRSTVTAFLRTHDIDHDGVVAVATALWDVPVHERRMAAVELLDARAALLVAADLPLVERFIREARTWALVDGLAVSVAGQLVEANPPLGTTLDRWATDGDFWIRRAALLALLVPLRRGGGDFERFGRYAETMLDEREFFVRKAIGWVLRDTARKRPDLVFDWLLPRAARASGVTLREAVKPLSPAQRDAVLAAASRRGER